MKLPNQDYALNSNNKHAVIKRVKFHSMFTAVICFTAIAFLSLSSCSSDDDSTIEEEEELIDPIPPTVVLNSGETGVFNAVLGSPTLGSLNYEVKAVAEDGFETLTIFKVLNGVSTEYETIDTNHPNYVANSNEFVYELNYILNNQNEVGTGLSFKAVITDVNNSTATLDFAQTNLRKPMTKSTVQVHTTLPPNGDDAISYYLHLNGSSEVIAVPRTQAENINLDQDIFAIFSVNDGSGYYLGSPESILETVLTDGMQTKATTKFKEQTAGSPFDLGLDTAYNIYDVYDVEHAYSVFEHNAHQQKAEQVGAIGKRFFFETDDNRTGVLQINSFEINGQDAHLGIDLFITQ